MSIQIENREALAILLVGDDTRYLLKLKTELRELLNRTCIISDCSIYTAQSLTTRHFDLVLIDVELSNCNDALAVLDHLRRGQEQIKSLLLLTNLDDPLFNRIRQAGARCYTFKAQLIQKLKDIISTVLQGKAYTLSDEHTSLQNITPDPSTSNIPGERFVVTRRQFQVLRLVKEGLSSKEIGKQLEIKDGTVKAHLGNLYEIFGIPKREPDKPNEFNSRNLLINKARTANIVIKGRGEA